MVREFCWIEWCELAALIIDNRILFASEQQERLPVISPG